MPKLDRQELIEQLVAEVAPVSPLAPATRTAWRWSVLVVGMGALSTMTGGWDRIATSAAQPVFLAQLVTLVAALLACSIVALKAVVPGDEPAVPTRMAASALCLLAVLVVAPLPAAPPPTAADFVAGGFFCALVTVATGVALFVALAAVIRRGAPFEARAAAAFAGAAALLAGSLLARLQCPAEERWHLLVWHFVPVVIGIVLVVSTRAYWWTASRQDGREKSPER